MKRFIVLITLLLLLSACNNVEKVEHVEVFVTTIQEENSEGLFVTTGYKEVNAITYIEESKNHIKTDIKAVEDVYELDGTYVKTLVFHSTFNKSKVTLAESSNHQEEEISEPATIFIPDGADEFFQLKNMTDEQENEVRENVLSFMELL